MIATRIQKCIKCVNGKFNITFCQWAKFFGLQFKVTGFCIPSAILASLIKLLFITIRV